MGKLDDKVAIITGSSKGIGKAIALEFAREGADVIINGFGSQKEVKDAEREIKQHGGEVMGFYGDVSDPDFVEEMVGKVAKHFGKRQI